MRRNFRFPVLFIILIVFLVSVLGFSKTDVKKSKYNLLIITIDTLRPDRLSCYNTKNVETPNIDKIAQRGVLFTKAFAHTPTTLPSHTNILLGTTPLYHGIHDNSNFIVDEEFLTLAEHLKSHGYATAAFVGAFPLDSRFGLTQGFDVYDDNYGSKSHQEFSYVERRAEVVIDKALDWIQERQNPWFLWVHCFDPHQRYDPPEPFKSQFRGRAYDGEVAYVDHALGRLFGLLQEKEHMDETLIIFTADHGEALGEHGEKTHGYFAYNATIWVPLIVYYPGLTPGHVHQPVCHADIFPTVCDILGLEKPSFLHGLSLLPLMEGKKLDSRMIYFESLYPYYTRSWAPLRGFIQSNEKYIDSPIPELYNLEEDFDEHENLAQTKTLSQYSKRLSRLIEEQVYADKKKTTKRVDREALEKLKSLGYVSGTQSPPKKSFTEKDDLKTLLPYQNKLMEAMRAYDGARFEESISILKNIIKERKDLSQAYSHLATVYKEQRRLQEAMDILEQGLENNPESYRIIETYGIILTEAGEYDRALEILQDGLKYIDYDPEIWNYLGVAYWKKGDFQNAHEAFQKVLALDDNYSIVFNNLGSLYLSQSLKTRNVDDLRQAIRNFKKAIELDPGYAEAYNGLGSAYGNAGNLEAAIQSWERALELKPDYDFPLYNLGLSYLSKGNKSRALGYFDRYKAKHYQRLSSEEKKKLDDLIQRCQDR